jgi:hypothetical protein
MKKITSCILTGALFCSASAHAEGTQIGTSPLLLALGVTSIFSQVQAGDRVGITARFNDFNGTYLDTTLDFTSYSLAYKSYFNSYAEGSYLELGAAIYDVAVSTNSNFTVGSTVMPIVVAGYEWTFDNGFVLGLEGGLGTGGGMGIFGVNTAYQF